ncbi:hypothetical protein SNEBB_007114 [Seison nebaliae]|nr:hypothetical protein SNEBB_007114 [Seison nebaliae]
MFTAIFKNYCNLSTQHPWEIMIGSLAITLGLITTLFFGDTSRICNYNLECESDMKISDTFILAIVKCLLLSYIYIQFQRLKKIGSKYLIGFVILFSLMSSIVFSVAMMSLVDRELKGIQEVLPFFVLVIDLTAACKLTSRAFACRSQHEIRRCISKHLMRYGPTVLFDTMTAISLIGIGTLSGIYHLEVMCCFGCLTVMANYISFMTFFPASLILIFETNFFFEWKNKTMTKQEMKTTNVVFTTSSSEEEDYDEENKEKYCKLEVKKDDKMNEVIKRIKYMLITVTSILYLYKNLLSNVNIKEENHSNYKTIEPKTSITVFYFTQLLHPNVDQCFAYLFGLFLIFSYIFFDEPATNNNNNNNNNVNETNLILEENKLKLSRDSSVTEPIIVRAEKFFNEASTQTEILTRSILKVSSFASTSAQSEDDEKPRNRNKPCFIIGSDSEDRDSLNSDDACSRTLTSIIDEPLKQMRTTNLEVIPNTITELTSSLLHKPDDIKKEKKEVPKHIENRDFETCSKIFRERNGIQLLSDNEIVMLTKRGVISVYKLEKVLDDNVRGILIRRLLLEEQLQQNNKTDKITELPYLHYDYSLVQGACCEQVIGYTPIPVGLAGPIKINGNMFHIPMATTEGCLVASTNRGCRAISQNGIGATATVYNEGMTRAPVLQFESAHDAALAKRWASKDENITLMKNAFDSTSRFARLQNIQTTIAGRLLYLRLTASTGDAMGMNMVSKGTEQALNCMRLEFPQARVLSLSGNFCTDKKASAINWISGRGKSVVAEVTIPEHIVRQTLKTSVESLVELNLSKNLIGSAMASTGVGGFNAHAANIVTAMYIACGQDPAQNINSANCITLMEQNDNGDLYMSCTMPSIECGTVGGGTVLKPQRACLEMLGVAGANTEEAGKNAKTFAEIVCSAVMAGELSLLSALTTGDLVKSHMKHNRSRVNMLAMDPSTTKSCTIYNVNCAKNKYKYVPPLNEAFRHVFIFHLNLGSNQIRNISKNTFHSMIIHKLNLSKNNLEYLHPQSFVALLMVKDIDLTSNQKLTTIPNALHALTNLTVIRISGKIKCGCKNLGWMKTMRNLHRIIVMDEDNCSNYCSDIRANITTTQYLRSKAIMRCPSTFNFLNKSSHLHFSSYIFYSIPFFFIFPFNSHE